MRAPMKASMSPGHSPAIFSLSKCSWEETISTKECMACQNIRRSNLILWLVNIKNRWITENSCRIVSWTHPNLSFTRTVIRPRALVCIKNGSLPAHTRHLELPPWRLTERILRRSYIKWLQILPSKIELSHQFSTLRITRSIYWTSIPKLILKKSGVAWNQNY